MEPYYKNDRVTLYHGDCREIIPKLGQFDLLLTDPPYGIRINKSSRLSISRGFSGETWDDAPIPLELIKEVTQKANCHIIWGGNYYEMPPTKCFLIWDKNNDGRDFADCEYAYTSMSSVARIFRMRPMNMDGGKVHPTQKPEKLMTWCILLAGDTIKTILDPFSGSGTTGVAAMKMGRSAVLIEREEKYCEIAARRLERESEQPGLFESIEGENG